jgi:CheY-like chemotaxis protein
VSGRHTVIATFDAGEAIEILESVRDIPLVITDIAMPGSMDGSGWQPQSETDAPTT